MANKEGFLKLSEAPFLKYFLSFVIGVLLQMVFNGGYYLSLPFVIWFKPSKPILWESCEESFP